MTVNDVTPIPRLQSYATLLYIKNNPLDLANYLPIALADIICNIWSSCLTILVTDYVKNTQYQAPSEKGSGTNKKFGILPLLQGDLPFRES